MGPGPAPWQGPPRLSPADCAVNKTRGLCHVHGPGEEASPLSCCMEDSEPLGPLCQCLQISSPLLRGPGGPGLLLPTSVFSSPRRQVSLLPNWASKPRFCFGGGGTGFLLALPCLGTVDTQVPCIEPSLLVSFSHIWADPRGTNFSLSSPPFWVDGAPPGSTWEGEEESLLPTLVQELGTFVREERSQSSLSKAAPYIS